MTLYNPENAIYLPAINKSFLSAVSKKLPKGRRFPHGVTPESLIFWKPNPLWHYPYLLHSIGQYRVGERPHLLMDRLNRIGSVLIGDSGGYQIGKGTLNGLKHVDKGPMAACDAVKAWREERDARRWIKEWIANECEYGMTIDMPLWATGASGLRSPFHRCSSDQLIAMTVQNLRYIDRFSPRESRWLNVIQGGDTYLDAIDWWSEVKWFRRGGYALAGSAGAAGGLVNLLMTVLFMRDDGAFEPGQDWLHVLGVSTPLWSVALTAIQRHLRKRNPALKVSFDSSSPVQLAGKYERVCLTPSFQNTMSTWTISSVAAPQRPSLARETCQDVFPFPRGPLGCRLKLNELNVREGPWEKRQFDSLSNALLVNHNIWVYLDAFSTANQFVANQDDQHVPADYLACLAVIEEAFMCSDASKASFVLERNFDLLQKVAPSTC